jgi:hypothetical protein
MRCSTRSGRRSSSSLQRVKTGDEAESPSTPFHVFKGKVRVVLGAIAAGRIQADGRPRSFGARTEGAAQMGNEKEEGEGSFRKKSSYKRPPDPLDIATASRPLLKREGALIDAALAARSHDVAAGDRAAARHAGLGASAAISSFLRTTSCSNRSIFWNRRSLVRRRK